MITPPNYRFGLQTGMKCFVEVMSRSKYLSSVQSVILHPAYKSLKDRSEIPQIHARVEQDGKSLISLISPIQPRRCHESVADGQVYFCVHHLPTTGEYPESIFHRLIAHWFITHGFQPVRNLAAVTAVSLPFGEVVVTHITGACGDGIPRRAWNAQYHSEKKQGRV